jgi:hypothetical protein
VEKLGRLFVVEDAWIAALRHAAGERQNSAHDQITPSSC